MSKNDFKPRECDSTMVHNLTSFSDTPGSVFSYPISALPANIQTQMPGLSCAYISGYVEPFMIDDSTTGLGELAVVRTDNSKGKGYNYLFFEKDDGKIYFAGPYKKFDEHHWNINEPTPIEGLFSHGEKYVINSPTSDESTTEG